jgi:hypothetical protein
MELNLLTKWANSGSSGCPSVYTTEDPDTLVIQGNLLDGETRGNLVNELDGEDAVSIPTETILRAADMIRGRQ